MTPLQVHWLKRGEFYQTIYQAWGCNTVRLPLNQRVAILLHEGCNGTHGKTGLAILRYSEAPIVAVIDRECAGKSLSELTGMKRDVPIVASVAAALEYKPEVLVIGIAPKGGAVPDDYWLDIKNALEAGMSLVNGLHTPLANMPELNALLKPGQLIWDVRKEPPNLDVAEAKARSSSLSASVDCGNRHGYWQNVN